MQIRTIFLQDDARALHKARLFGVISEIAGVLPRGSYRLPISLEMLCTQATATQSIVGLSSLGCDFIRHGNLSTYLNTCKQ